MQLRHVVVFLLALSTSRSAHAQALEKSAAELLFREGKRLVEAGELTRGCLKFSESQKIDPQLGTLLYLATCHEQQGKTATAWVEFTEALALAERQRHAERRALAQERQKALEAKLSMVRFKYEGQLSFRLDGTTLTQAMVETPLPVDPGEHRLSVSGVGLRPLTLSFSVPEGPTHYVVEVPPLEPDRKTPMPAPHEKPASASRSRSGPLVVGGISLAAVGVGAYFGLSAIDKKRESDAACASAGCSPAGLDAYEQARSRALVSTVAFGVGLVGGVISLVWFLRSSPAPDRSGMPPVAAGFRVNPAVGLGHVGLHGRF